jgi:hypothetical protein
MMVGEANDAKYFYSDRILYCRKIVMKAHYNSSLFICVPSSLQYAVSGSWLNKGRIGTHTSVCKWILVRIKGTGGD